MEKRFSQNFNKLFYSIGEVAEILGVNASLIRFWEMEFKQIQPRKNAKGNRKFTPKDIEILQEIYELVKVKGFTLEGAKKELSIAKSKLDDILNQEEGSIPILKLVDKLIKIREELLKLKV